MNTSTSSLAGTEARQGRASHSNLERRVLERAIVETVAYADVFDFPLTIDELHRYLVSVPANRGLLRSVLHGGGLVRGLLSQSGRYYMLAGHEASVETRRQRAAVSSHYWPTAVKYGRLIGNLPFVRMVGVTGALAMDNVADGDIDYMVVTEPGRLWLCRGMIVGLVRLARLRGVVLCPNYFVSERALELSEHTLFTAHEVTQMVPLTGLETYTRLRQLNRWTEGFLPNASGAPRRVAAVEPRRRRTRRVVEATLRGRLGGPLEHWEMSRKMRKLRSQGARHVEAAFSPDWCKGHFGDHGQLTLQRYGERLQALEGQLP